MGHIKRILVLLVSIIHVIWLSGCKKKNISMLSIKTGEKIVYQCNGGEKIKARYFSLSDQSLYFVKLTLPNGKEYTLPQIMSASGVRYTDERELVWWTKGNEVLIEKRNENGEWKPLYKNCRAQSGQ